jgi:hypothetical protein
MNLASKLGEDTAKGGETLVTEAAFEHLTGRRGLEVEKRQVAVSGINLPYYTLRPQEGFGGRG